jgi:HEPN domain-containing protein
MAMTQQELVNFWIEKAKDDLEAANAMFKANKLLWCGFICQQSIEKALKGYYVHVNNEKQPYIHDVEILAKKLDLLDTLDDGNRQTLKKLKPLYSEARYQESKDKIAEFMTKKYCTELLSETEVLLKWILELMKPSDNTQNV